MIVSLEERAYEHIRRQLMRGALRPGEALREATIGKEIGVSRTPVRHAIRQLEREGLVAQRPGFGSYVKQADPQDVRELAELRLVVERGAAEYAAQRISGEQLTELKNVCREMLVVARAFRDGGKGSAVGTQPQGDASDLVERNNRADLRFHEIIVAASGNERMAKLVRDVDLINRICVFQMPYPADVVPFLARCYREHYRIYRAIRHGDAVAASRLMEQHLRTAAQRVVEWVMKHETRA